MKINREIKNPRCEVEKGIGMNDQDYLYSVLLLERSLSNQYSQVLNDASNEYLYEDYFVLFEDTKDAYREIKNLFFQKGWLCYEVAPEVLVQRTVLDCEKNLDVINDE